MKNKKPMLNGAKTARHKNGLRNGQIDRSNETGSTKSSKTHTALECNCGLDGIFPRWTPLFVFVITLTVRITYVSQGSNWWILHPDEIFQSVEVAFSEVYGYGFRFYEHLPPPVNMTSSVEEQEAKFGMYSLRSFLYPRFFVTVFYVTKFFGVTTSPYLIARVAHTCISSLLPLAVYNMARSLFTCKNISVLATILSAFSVHLSVFGSHTLVNSFLSPFLIFGVTPILRHFKEMRMINVGRKDTSGESYTAQYKSDGQTMTNTNIKEIDPTKPQEVKKEMSQYKNGVAKSSTYIRSSHDQYRKERVTYVLCGFLLGLCCYIRPDTSLFVGLIILTFTLIFIRQEIFSLTVFMFIYSITGFSLGTLLAGLEDWYRYGKLFISPIQWFKFNVGSNIPAVLYGLRSPARYWEDILYPDVFTASLNVLTIIGLIFIMTKSGQTKLGNFDRSILYALTCSAAIIFVPYATIGHKETRFLHNLLVLLVIITSYSLHSILCYANYHFLSKSKSKAMIYFIFGLYIANSYGTFPHSTSDTESLWVYKSASASADVNQCLDFIGSQKDVTGVAIDSSLYLTAAFSVLRHDVPLLTFVHNEYHEYDSTTTPSPSRHKYPMPERLRIINRFSDFIHGTNVDYLSRFLLVNSQYNYVINSVSRPHPFLQLGYELQQSFGSFVVLRRNLSNKETVRIQNKGRKMSFGNNATILEYEGSWLYTAGVYKKAAERMEASLKIDDSRWRPFQILGLSYAKLKDYVKAKETETRCFVRHTEKTCRSHQDKITLQEEYSNFELK